MKCFACDEELEIAFRIDVWPDGTKRYWCEPCYAEINDAKGG